ncbi:class I SAM-dependent methyltransferase [Leptolinea tardivitalis]|uniref:class I SAM-dependent methyltransferase n=1 Tax=Leptolinea tardivitalis TaxID=229920 RepID=UPI00078028C1|nr:methyltransferase domain-containing protein [Leptolinea tardivitalis]GAP21847.1 methylase [Leptolinea tardivitalis]
MTKKITRSILLGVGLAGAVMAAWRIVSRIKPLPCPPWLSWMLENPLTRGMNADLLIKRAGLKRGMRVLDAGCGAGRITVPAATMVGETGEVIALDIQPAMLEMTRNRVKAAGLENVRYMLVPLGENMIPENRFDRAFLVTVLGEIPDRLAAMKEIAASLKPGGILSVTEMLPDPHYQSIRTVRLLAHQAGLVETRVFGNTMIYTLNLRKPIPAG